MAAHGLQRCTNVNMPLPKKLHATAREACKLLRWCRSAPFVCIGTMSRASPNLALQLVTVHVKVLPSAQ